MSKSPKQILTEIQAELLQAIQTDFPGMARVLPGPADPLNATVTKRAVDPGNKGTISAKDLFEELERLQQGMPKPDDVPAFIVFPYFEWERRLPRMIELLNGAQARADIERQIPRYGYSDITYNGLPIVFSRSAPDRYMLIVMQDHKTFIRVDISVVDLSDEEVQQYIAKLKE